MNLNRFFKIRLTGPSGTPVYNIDGTTPGLGITAGSMHLEEILCDGELELGACNANKFEVEVYGLTHDVSGYAIEVYNDYDPNNPEYLFVGKIDSSETDKYNMYRDIVAYDAMYWARNEEVGEWWKDFWTDHEWTYLRDLRNSLCEFVGISVAVGQVCYNDDVVVYDADAEIPATSYGPLVTASNDFLLTSSGDNFLVILPVDVTTTAPIITQIKFGALLRMICELQACCPNINRLGQMEFVTIGVDGTPRNIDQAYDTNNAEFQDYTTDTPTGFNVYDTSEELAQRVPDTSANTNPYAVSGNVFLLSATAEQISNILSPLIPAIRAIVYRPATIPMIVSDLSIRLGNAVSSTHRGVRSTHFVLAQELSGSSLVDQTITSPAYGKKLNDKASGVNDLIAQGLKFAQIKQDIDEISLQVGTLDGTVSELVLTTDTLSLKVGKVVDNDDKIRAAEIMLAINDDGSTVKISANHLELNGYVTFSALRTDDGTTTINGGNITTGTITIGSVFSANADTGVVQIGGWTAQGDYLGTIDAAADSFFLSQSGHAAYVNLAGGNVDCVFYSAGKFAVDSGGNLYASSGYFGGSLSGATGTFAGDLSAAGGTFSGQLKVGTTSYPFIIGTSSSSGTSSAAIYSRGTSFAGMGGLGVPLDNYVYIGGDGFSYWNGAQYTTDYTTSIRPGFVLCAGDTTADQTANRAVSIGMGDIGFYYGGSTNLRTASAILGYRVAQIQTQANQILISGSVTVNGGTVGTVQLRAGQTSSPASVTVSAGNPSRGDLSGTWYLNGSPLLSTSDRNKKNTITYNYAEYDEFFDSLRPALFKYNDGTSGRLHTGFIAQDVEEALSKGGISTQNFAGLATCNDGGNVLYYLRYEEFISLNTWQIQQLKTRVAELEKQIATLQNKEKEIN